MLTTRVNRLVPGMLRGAIQTTMAAASDAAAARLYAEYFGDPGGQRDKVLANLTTMLTAITAHKLYLYYRGKHVQRKGKETDYPFPDTAMDFGGMTQGDYYGAATRKKQRHYQSDDIHIRLGVLLEAEPPTGRVALAAGTIIHEMSHWLCDTRDVKYVTEGGKYESSGMVLDKSVVEHWKRRDKVQPPTGMSQDKWDEYRSLLAKIEVRRTYGEDACREMASRRPEKAVENADNYCYYCLRCPG